MRAGYIYKTTNLINGKVYFGKSEKPTFNPKYYGSGNCIAPVKNKYGKENLKVEVVSWHETLDELNASEKETIKNGKLEYGENCYNIAPGGEGGDTFRFATKEAKAKRIKKQTESVRRYYKNEPPEKKAKRAANISKNRKGKGLRDYAPLSEETKRKISASNKIAAKKRPREWYENHAKAMGKRKGKPTHNAETIIYKGKKYQSLSAASKATGVSRYLITKSIRCY